MLLATVGCAAALALAACGDDDGDQRDDDERDRELDVIALVAAAFEEEPRRLPDGIELDEVTSEDGWTSQNVAVLSFWFTGTGGATAHASAAVFRDEKQAREELADAVEMLEAVESEDARGRYCFWDFPLYLDVDDASTCMGRSGVVYLEVEKGPAGEDDPEAALELLQSLENYFDDLAEDATSRVRLLKPRPLAAILASVPPPAPPDGKPVGLAEGTEVTTEVQAFGLVRQVNWPSGQDDRMAAFIAVFDSETGAESYKQNYFGSGNVATKDESTCATADSRSYRVCVRLVGETAILLQRQPERTTLPALDQSLLAWMATVADHVQSIRNGRLPAAPEDVAPEDVAPEVDVTSTLPPFTATLPPATATPTVGPAVTRVNAGTWTFDVVVTANTCPGDRLQPGATFRTQYEFTDSNGDAFIASGERFSIYQYEPFAQELGTLTATLPATTFGHPSALDALTGLATVKLTFISVNEAYIDYVEQYVNCRLTAE